MKKNAKKKTKKLEKQDKMLILTFIGLIALVVVLGVVALNLDNIYKDDSNDLTIPILEEHSESELSVEAKGLKKDDSKEYILVVTNYKEKEILEKAITYDLDITPTENIEVKVYKNNSSDNLITEDDLLVENNKLSAKKKIEDTYKVVIKAIKTPKDKEKITIKIHS